MIAFWINIFKVEPLGSADRPDVGGETNRKVKNGTKISGPSS